MFSFYLAPFVTRSHSSSAFYLFACSLLLSFYEGRLLLCSFPSQNRGCCPRPGFPALVRVPNKHLPGGTTEPVFAYCAPAACSMSPEPCGGGSGLLILPVGDPGPKSSWALDSVRLGLDPSPECREAMSHLLFFVSKTPPWSFSCRWPGFLVGL